MAMAMRARSGGFTYLGLIILVAIIGLVGAASLKAASLLRRAAAEEELLEIGAAFSAALQSYAEATPQGQPIQPPTLKELLKDPRVPGVRRHLRKMFVDPVTGKDEWGVMYLGEKRGVIGIYSLSNAKPLKVANFDARFMGLEGKQKLSDWKFMAKIRLATPIAPLRPATPGQPSLFAPTAPGAGPRPMAPGMPVSPLNRAPEAAPAEDKPAEDKPVEANPAEPPAEEKSAEDKAREEKEKEEKEKEEQEKEEKEKEGENKDDKDKDEAAKGGKPNEPRLP